MREKLRAEWFWTDRWFASSAFGLPLEAQGLYRNLLSRAWANGGSIPQDPEVLRRLGGASSDEWSRAWPLVSPYWTEREGRLVNEAQLEVLAEAASRKAEAVALGKRRAATAKRGEGGRFLASGGPAVGSSGGPQNSPAVDQRGNQPPSLSPSLNQTQSPEAAITKRELPPLSGLNGREAALAGAIRGSPLILWQTDPKVTSRWVTSMCRAFPTLDLAAEARKCAGWWATHPARVRRRRTCTLSLREWFDRAAESKAKTEGAGAARESRNAAIREGLREVQRRGRLES